MNVLSRWTFPTALWLVVLAAAAPGFRAQAEPTQDEAVPEKAPAAEAAEPDASADDADAPDAGSDEASERTLRFFVESEAWVAQPKGLEFFPASEIDPADPFGTELLAVPHDTSTKFLYRAGYRLPEELGTLLFTYYAHDDDSVLIRSAPGQFTFGELWTHPLFAGVNNDGRADAFESTTTTRLRDWRLDYQRVAFETPHASGRWSIGWRKVSYNRSMDAIYHALVPGLPPLIPPVANNRADLVPAADTAFNKSLFDGRGPAVGIDLDFPLWKNRVMFEGGASLAVLRGTTETAYSATNHYYLLNNPALGYDNVILSTPYLEFEQSVIDPSNNQPVRLINSITQQAARFGLQSPHTSTTSQLLESYLGFRWQIAWRYAVFAGLRSTRYTDVGTDLRPEGVVVLPASDGGLVFNVEDVSEVHRSATYEGFYFGVSLRVF